MKAVILKIPWRTNFFNKNQKVFVVFISGNQSCRVLGKYRGKGRKINAWFKWDDKNMHLVNFKQIEISETDYNKIFL